MRYIDEYEQDIKNKIALQVKHNVATKKSGFFMSLPKSIINLSQEGQDRLQFILDNSNWERQIERKLYYNLSYSGRDSILILPGTTPSLIKPIQTQLPVEDMLGNLSKLTGTLATRYINSNETGYLYFDISKGQMNNNFEVKGYSLDEESNEFIQTKFTWKKVQTLFNTNFLPKNNSQSIENITPAVYFANPIGHTDGQGDLNPYLNDLSRLGDVRVSEDSDLELNVFIGMDKLSSGRELKPGYSPISKGKGEKKKYLRGWISKLSSHNISSANEETLAETHLISRVQNVSATQFKELGDDIENRIYKTLGLIPSDNQKSSGTNMMNLEAKAMLNADRSPLLIDILIFENKLTELYEKIMIIDIQSGNSEFYSSEDKENLVGKKIKVLMESEVKEEVITETQEQDLQIEHADNEEGINDLMGNDNETQEDNNGK